MKTEDTIAAISTAPGEAGISVIRISGPDSLAIADKVFRCSGPPPSARAPFTFVYGKVVDEDKTLDNALLLIMKSPKSYTGEDVVEIQGHGGRRVTQRVLRRIIEAGARPAEPGEFTKRAFLNGRMDLTRAEAVLDLIRAQSDRAADAAMEQLEGRIKNCINELYDNMLSVSADLEASLDFPEDELPETASDDILRRMEAAVGEMRKLESSWDHGRHIRDGSVAVISGKPNVGKSTLLNALLGHDRAIVSHIPGTTRDAIEDVAIIDGYALRLVDTAGIRETEDHVESEGIRRSKAWIEKADIHIHVIDASEPLSPDDRAILDDMPSESSVVVFNKTDKGDAGSDVDFITSVRTSLKNDKSADGVRSALARILSAETSVLPIGNAAISERHLNLIRSALHECDLALRSLMDDFAKHAPIASDHVRSALEFLAQITGRVYHDDLLNSIFSRFCIGK